MTDKIVTKAERTRKIVAQMDGKHRPKDIIAKLMTELDIGHAHAVTYLYNARKQLADAAPAKPKAKAKVAAKKTKTATKAKARKTKRPANDDGDVRQAA